MLFFLQIFCDEYCHIWYQIKAYSDSNADIHTFKDSLIQNYLNVNFGHHIYTFKPKHFFKKPASSYFSLHLNQQWASIWNLQMLMTLVLHDGQVLETVLCYNLIHVYLQPNNW